MSWRMDMRVQLAMRFEARRLIIGRTGTIDLLPPSSTADTGSMAVLGLVLGLTVTGQRADKEIKL